MEAKPLRFEVERVKLTVEPATRAALAAVAAARRSAGRGWW